MSRRLAGRRCLVALFLAVAVLPPVWSQQAKVTALVGIVSRQAAGATTWQPCKLNMPLTFGDQLRTAMRSRCQVTFADGSVVRLGERSDLTIRTPGSMVVNRGRMYGNFAKGASTTIGGRSAVAAIKGTHIDFIVGEDGKETIRCYEGQVYVAQAGAMTKTGTADSGTTTTLTDDALTEPDGYWNGATLLILAGTNEGEQRTVVTFSGATHTVTVDVAFPQAIDNTSQYELTLPTAPGVVTLHQGEESIVRAGEMPSEPIATAPEEFAGGQESPEFQQITPGVAAPTFAGSPSEEGFREDNVSVDQSIAEAVGAAPYSSLNVIVRSADPTRRAMGPAGANVPSAALLPPTHTGAIVSPIATWGATAPSPFAGALRAVGEPREPPEARNEGGLLGERLRIELSAFGSNRNVLGSVRIRPSGVLGNLYFELGGTNRELFDGQSVTDLTAAYVVGRGKGLGDLRIGRQRFLLGPVNNSNLGTLIDFDLADGVSWCPDTGGRLQLDFAYLWDMAPLADEFGGTGWFGRASVTTDYGVFSVNGLTTDAHRPGPGDTELDGDLGYSFDLAVPLKRTEVELYGELGEDPWDRTLYTVGLYFPCLLYSADTDLLVEYASREYEPKLWTLRAYHTLSDEWQAVLAFELPEGSSLDYGLGFTYRFEIR
jgi:hypothetical protein